MALSSATCVVARMPPAPVPSQLGAHPACWATAPSPRGGRERDRIREMEREKDYLNIFDLRERDQSLCRRKMNKFGRFSLSYFPVLGWGRDERESFCLGIYFRKYLFVCLFIFFSQKFHFVPSIHFPFQGIPNLHHLINSSLVYSFNIVSGKNINVFNYLYT